MAAYRFCRSDDIPLLVEAYNTCVVPAGRPAISVSDFKQLIRELNLWTSSCMVASAEKQPIGVLLAAKRDHANWIHTIAIHPDHRRQGHGKHLMTSLSSKLAILGPTRMLAEVPQQRADLRGFVEACGYREEFTWQDALIDPVSTRRPPEELIMPITLDRLIEDAVFDRSVRRCWARSVDSLRNMGDLAAHAVASEEGIQAYLATRDDEILALGVRHPRFAPLLGALLAHVAPGGCLRLLRASPDEIDPALLAGLGFEPGACTIACAVEAQAA